MATYAFGLLERQPGYHQYSVEVALPQPSTAFYNENRRNPVFLNSETTAQLAWLYARAFYTPPEPTPFGPGGSLPTSGWIWPR